MATWAAKLACAKELHQEDSIAGNDTDHTIAVVDANALISLGEQARTLADILVTTEEVVAEIRDATSRASIDTLSLVRRDPTDDAVRAVALFATRTGDLHQLSAEDVRLLALAYTYEVEIYGDAHLKRFPGTIRAHSRRPAAARMPGWGETGNDEDWEAIDQVQDADDTASAERSRTAASANVAQRRSASADNDDTTWEIVKRSKNAARRAKRKAENRAKIAANDCGPNEKTQGAAGKCLEPSASPNRSRVHSDAEAGSISDAEGSIHSVDAAECTDISSHDQSQQTHCPAVALNSTSRVCLITSDFPMQNVALQMGLGLQSKGGRSIIHIQRSVLRCDACSQVVKSQNKMFCPACGHATLSRVSVCIGPNGAEHYGVRKRHTLKGTRFSLPKPRGGKGSPAPILSEDVYNAKVHRRKPKPSADPLEELTLGEYKKHSSHSRGVSKGLSYLVTGPGNNPNERKNMPRSNRRR